MATCQICKYAGNPKDQYPCSDCKGYSKYEYEKPQTNADRIRAMSDDMLARWILLFVMDCAVASGVEEPEWEEGQKKSLLNGSNSQPGRTNESSWNPAV